MQLQQTAFEIFVSKEEIAHDQQFLLLPQYFQLYSLFNFYWDKKKVLDLLYVAKSSPFPSYNNSAADVFEHILSKIENLYNWKDNLWLKVGNIVAKGEIACFEQFLLLSLCFQKAVCCRGVRKRLYVAKG